MLASSSSACARAGGQARSSNGPATKITVLPANGKTGHGPLAPPRAWPSPLSPNVQRAGAASIGFDAPVQVISKPTETRFGGARDGWRWPLPAPHYRACRKISCAKSMQLPEILRTPQPGAVVLAHDTSKCERLGERSYALANNLKRDLWTNERRLSHKSRIRFCGSRAKGKHALARIGRHKNCGSQTNPAGDWPRGFSNLWWNRPAYFKTIAVERIDVGLQLTRMPTRHAARSNA